MGVKNLVDMVRLYLETGGSQRANPDGDWYRKTTRLTERVWFGYGTEIRLETAPSVLDGWRVVQSNPDSDEGVILFHGPEGTDDGLTWKQAVEYANAYMAKIAHSVTEDREVSPETVKNRELNV